MLEVAGKRNSFAENGNKISDKIIKAQGKGTLILKKRERD